MATRSNSTKKRPNPSDSVHRSLWQKVLPLLLLVLTFTVYAPVTHFSFVNFDDPDYVTNNLHVRGGLTLDGVRWAFTSGESANWFPVTRISHMLDVQFFGLDPGPHHLVNVAFHALATLLLFAFLFRVTGALIRSAFVAAVFAVHPLHVESVAWISERKDVLSACFWFLALWAYVRYTERPQRARYALVLVAFACGLMSKPMVVTLPFVLILLDFWPLRRGWRIREKLPFFALALAASADTFAVQQTSGAVRTLATFPLASRLANAIVSYAVYLEKTVWPSGLAVFYPYPAGFPTAEIALSLAVLAAVSFAVWRTRRTHPYLLAGWLWFLGTLVPVIGLVQVGAQARADRYMYIPIVGLAIMAAWGAAELTRKPPALAAAGAAVIAACSVVTVAQAMTWRNSETLFQHAIDVTGPNYLAQHNLGAALLDDPARLPDAIAHLRQALRLNPDSARIHTDLGSALAKSGYLEHAIAEYREALRLAPGDPVAQAALAAATGNDRALDAAAHARPDDPEAHNNLGSALARQHRTAEAVAEFQASLRLRPDYAEAHNNLGSAFAEMGRVPDAISEYQAALRIKPEFAAAHVNLGAAFAGLPGRLPQAIAEYQAALHADPNSVEAHNDLGSAFAATDRLPEAVAQYEAAARIDPRSAEVQYNLGATLSRMPGRAADAIAHLEQAIRLKPDYAEAHNNLGVVLSQSGRTADAIRHFEAALRLNPRYEDARHNLRITR